jgi:hypothetical protein
MGATLPARDAGSNPAAGDAAVAARGDARYRRWPVLSKPHTRAQNVATPMAAWFALPAAGNGTAPANDPRPAV